MDLGSGLRRHELHKRAGRISGFKTTDRALRFARAMLLVGLLGALAACNSRGGSIPYAPAGFGTPDRDLQAAVEAYDLPLGPMDVVKISVFRVPELSGDYQVDARGQLDMPLIGSINARAYRPEEFANQLEQLYGARYLASPDITVRVIATNQTAVTIEGGVNSPGIYPLPGRTTLLGAIALARGINANDGNPKRIAIFRKRGGQTVAAAFDLVAIRHGEMEDPMIYPGDTIVVDFSQLRSIYRDLLQTLPILALFNNI
jgi:polysaccharide biosynthesis/export protein